MLLGICTKIGCCPAFVNYCLVKSITSLRCLTGQFISHDLCTVLILRGSEYLHWRSTAGDRYCYSLIILFVCFCIFSFIIIIVCYVTYLYTTIPLSIYKSNNKIHDNCYFLSLVINVILRLPNGCC